uniref:Uncharacterized protein n=1 Tax=Ditylum brightwellii TaxID=49249 RepID=A0A6U3U1H4_9STRA|mmetsp:Transcript_38714/g.58133  ORF Transcript_38714/g.58133 Transcript_38714/m.58133 type:complete len:275 (+) Transcript_38714:99-923(+)
MPIYSSAHNIPHIKARQGYYLHLNLLNMSNKYSLAGLLLLAILSVHTLNAFIPFHKVLPPLHLGRSIHSNVPVLFAKRKRKKSSKKDDKKTATSEPQTNLATQRPPATLAGVVEDHRFEQFFYDEGTANQLYQLVDRFERPLLLCNPTLAVLAEKKNKSYRLLDRDTRFNFLSGYVQFSLSEPHLITDYDFDAVFIDPPFANVTPEQVARCLRLIDADKVPLYVAYNSRREETLLKALNALDAPNLERKWSLSYKEGVSFETQDSIWLYGPENM